LDTLYVKKYEQQRKLQWIGILGNIEEEVDRRERGEGTIEDEIRNTGRSWKEVKGIAGDRNAWKFFMDVLRSTRSKSN